MNSDLVKNISKFESWILASRPKTLPAAIAPVLVGTAVAINDNKFNLAAFLIALICSILIQVGTNFVNDLYDFLAGSDREDRLGPRRALASGLITVNEMKFAIFFTFGITFLLGMYLVYTGGVIVLLIGLLSIFAGIAYTAGPYPLAYNGLGDIFVFLFFGFVGTVGTYYVQAYQINVFIFLASIPVGALITNILVVNNYRDIEADKISGKHTLAVKFGRKFTRYQYLLFMILSYAILPVIYFGFNFGLFIFIPLLSLPIAIKLIRMIFTFTGQELNNTLALTAKLSAIYGLLFAIGILL
jgi:1,4-dihydroxy-2-naphthoate octaprenyltransferase